MKKQTSKNILHLSVYSGLTRRHGGVKRSEQLCEYFLDAGGKSLNPYANTSFKKFISNPISIFRFFYILFCYIFFWKGSLLGVSRFIFRGYHLANNLNNILNGNQSIYVEYAPGLSQVLVIYLMHKDINFTLIPHNIEFLVHDRGKNKDFRSDTALYEFERRAFCFADKVLTISLFDCAVVRSLGGICNVFSYYPPLIDLQRIENVRQIRSQKSDFDYFLFVGTVVNPPSLVGFMSLLQNFDTLFPGSKLKVCGFGTENYKHLNTSSIQILGCVSDSLLDDLLFNCKCIIIDQPQTSGFLTRLVENNLCNIPQVIVSNYTQAQGLSKYGIFNYSDYLEYGYCKTSFEYFKNNEVLNFD